MKSKIFRIALLSLVSGALLLSSCDKDDDDNNDNTSQTAEDSWKRVEVKRWTETYESGNYTTAAYNTNSDGFVTSIDYLEHYEGDNEYAGDYPSSMEITHNSSSFKLIGKYESSWDAKFNPNGTVSEFVVTVSNNEKETRTFKYDCSYNDALQLSNIKYTYQTDNKEDIEAGEASATRNFEFAYDQDGALVSMIVTNDKIEYDKIEYKYDKDIPNPNGQFWYETYGAYSDDFIDDWTDEPVFMLLGMFGKASTKFPTSMTETYTNRQGEVEVDTYHYEFTLNEDGNILTEKLDYEYPVTITFEY